MIIDCISDLHGYFPKLEGGDLLLIAGDLTARDKSSEYEKVKVWLKKQPYKKKVMIAGNHDNFIMHHGDPNEYFADVAYLCDSGTEFEGLKIWGSPWTKNFLGQNPHCKAFGLDFDSQMMEKFSLIPEDTSILITHSPPYGILDDVGDLKVGSPYLANKVQKISKLKLHLFGHIHEGYGSYVNNLDTQFVNASFVNEYYKPINSPVRIILEI